MKLKAERKNTRTSDTSRAEKVMLFWVSFELDAFSLALFS